MATALHEIRFHGRGGQGSVSAAALLSVAAFLDGYEAQAFPRFGSERRGAPVEAYVRISREPIRRHNQIYEPDAVVIQDPTLLRSENVTAGLRDGGFVILNGEPPATATSSSAAVWLGIPASRIGRACLGRPLPNTALLGALAAVTEWVSMDALEEAVTNHLAHKGEEVVLGNIQALHQGREAAVHPGPPA